MTLRRQLLKFLLIPLVVFLVGSSLLFYLHSLKETKLDAALHLTTYTGEHLRGVLARVDAVGLELATLRASGEIEDYYMFQRVGVLDKAEDVRGHVENDFRQVVTERPSFRRLHLIDRSGKSVVDIVDGRIIYRHADFSSHPWFQPAIASAGEQTFVSGPIGCTPGGESRIWLSRSLSDDGDHTANNIAIIAVQISTQDLLGPSDAQGKVGRHTHNHLAHLIDSSGCVVASEATDSIGADYSALLSAQGEAVDPVDGGVILSSRLLMRIGGLQVLSTWQLDEIHAMATRFGLFNAMLIGISLLMLVILLTLITRRLTKPLAELQREVEGFSDKTPTFELLPEVLENRNEVGSLARTFQRMGISLAARLQALQESEEKFRSISEAAQDALIIIDDDGLISYWNAAANRIFGYAEDEVLGQHMRGLLMPERLHANIWSVLDLHRNTDRGKVVDHTAEMVALRKDGVEFPIELSVSLTTIGGHWHTVCLARDITKRKQAVEIIEHQASFDALTDLPNRRLLLDRLNHSLARCNRHGHFAALIFIDLDNFKTINDSLGHAVGDAVLIEISARLKQGLRQEDISARLGGDEFVVAFSELSDDDVQAAELAQAGAEKLHQMLTAPIIVQEHELYVTPSMGIALFPDGDETAADVLRQADTAMYRAKEAGKNAIRFFLPSMQVAAEERLSMQNDLQLAIERDELCLHYQPKVDDEGNVVGSEALLRWQHPERGLVTPGEFIALAEDTGHIVEIGTWVLRHALAQLKIWTDAGIPTSFDSLSINVSIRQFHQPDFADKVDRILAETGADPRLLTLEITEGVLVEDPDDIIDKMQQLKHLGIRFSIDDFGTGYSSLSYLKRLPLDEIKIDRSFIRDVITDPDDANLVETIIIMAQKLGLAVVAEGVESAEQLHFLLEKGCCCFQGYHLSRPQPAPSFGDYLKQSGVDNITLADQITSPD